jgi:hypothetical protein
MRRLGEIVKRRRPHPLTGKRERLKNAPLRAMTAEHLALSLEVLRPQWKSHFFPVRIVRL